ncbi:hypothetical protein G195_003542 [Phytophthora kernoviae 00238/432]|uniref:DUF4162 domain-containing protein n=1 Tax=Phytophthora kernoviae 00238/432 TaxID=1284355 RepID=A0A8J4S9T9_9STRA|nr:hypothetical protein G195_003542 [Phytophthora kernoviae 00238/432]
MEEVAAISHRVAIMDQGHIIACGTEAELRERVAFEEKIVLTTLGVGHAVVEELKLHPRVRAVEVSDKTLTITLPSAQQDLQDMLFICSKHEISIQSLKVEEPDLETLFLNLTGPDMMKVQNIATEEEAVSALRRGDLDFAVIVPSNLEMN